MDSAVTYIQPSEPDSVVTCIQPLGLETAAGQNQDKNGLASYVFMFDVVVDTDNKTQNCIFQFVKW